MPVIILGKKGSIFFLYSCKISVDLPPPFYGFMACSACNSSDCPYIPSPSPPLSLNKNILWDNIVRVISGLPDDNYDSNKQNAFRRRSCLLGYVLFRKRQAINIKCWNNSMMKYIHNIPSDKNRDGAKKGKKSNTEGKKWNGKQKNKLCYHSLNHRLIGAQCRSSEMMLLFASFLLTGKFY